LIDGPHVAGSENVVDQVQSLGVADVAKEEAVIQRGSGIWSEIAGAVEDESDLFVDVRGIARVYEVVDGA